MEIIDTTIIRTAESTTANGSYVLDYTVLNRKLERVQATIRSTKAEDNGERYLGNIVYENGSINSNFLYNIGKPIAPMIADFEKFMDDILEVLQEEIKEEK